MGEAITINLENLTKDERNTLTTLLKKANSPNLKSWKPSQGEPFHFIYVDGTICSTTYHDTLADNNIIHTGRYAKTEAECLVIREREYINEELRQYANEHNETEINWKNGSQDKYSFYYDCEDEVFDTDVAQLFNVPNTVYFTSNKICIDAIKSVGEDRIKNYFYECSL